MSIQGLQALQGSFTEETEVNREGGISGRVSKKTCELGMHDKLRKKGGIQSNTKK